CAVGRCDAASGACVAAPRPEGAPCDDELFCTVGETCDAGGACEGGSARVCAGDGPCAVGACDEAADACVQAPAPDDTPCDDGLFCTTGERCVTGACEGGARDCSARDGACR